MRALERIHPGDHAVPVLLSHGGSHGIERGRDACSRAPPPPDVRAARGCGTLVRMRMTPRRLKIGMSLWLPNLFSGIRVRRFADDWTSAMVELHVNVFTRNYVKTAFGGSMSAMTDPYFFMLVTHQLGRDYVVWDTRGEIEFVRPGRGVLTARFEVPAAKADELRERAIGGRKVLEWFETEIVDEAGHTVARVRREVYVREKRRSVDAAATASP